MNRSFYQSLVQRSLAGADLEDALCERILTDASLELLPLLDAAYQVRKAYVGNRVHVHVLNNVQNGLCPEDCAYCAQSHCSRAPIDIYNTKSEQEILAEAQGAYKSGAFRYCLVYSGRGPTEERIDQLCTLIPAVKSRYPLEVCVSTGIVDAAGVQRLKDAGLDRLNHNLNTSAAHYPRICQSHTYRDRLRTLKHAQRAGLPVCSGLIVGMGELPRDIVELAQTLRRVEARSIPVNFLVPIAGNVLTQATGLSPTYCLRVLVLFRLLHPRADVRAAAGREGHLRDLEVLCLYPANSLFLDGYLNTKGAASGRILRMIRDAGFEIVSDFSVDDLLPSPTESFAVNGGTLELKTRRELRPTDT